MTTYKHIVQVYPVELGEPNLYKVKGEGEFDTKEAADAYINRFNEFQEKTKGEVKAVYLGRVNEATGELE